MEEKQAKNVVVLKLSRVATFTNYFIICSAESLPQVKAIAEEVALRLPRKHHLGKEGFPASSWVMLDYGDFILHIFLPETRKFYGLERIWADAPSETVKSGNPSI
ncbi:MAG: ribosome silencing factor [Candidatus Omnitrophica bacterium]|nr:ribosome silencing factor [Candidatus Omnitrophota bacterium]